MGCDGQGVENGESDTFVGMSWLARIRIGATTQEILGQWETGVFLILFISSDVFF